MDSECELIEGLGDFGNSDGSLILRRDARSNACCVMREASMHIMRACASVHDLRCRWEDENEAKTEDVQVVL